ncbi:MAG: hypothetical protein H7X95_03390 [Deltaproteobacteria bacterium]|nr:hypothetical protein [Deltaproteobacteria bacterium]
MAAKSGRWKRLLIKIAVAAGLLCVLGFLFMRSVRDSVATPYTIHSSKMRNWKLAINADAGPNDPILMLQPPPELTQDLFGQVFKRVMESMETSSSPAIPLVLKREFDQAFAGRVTPETLLATAQAAGLDANAFQPKCLAHRRVSDPRATQQIYFVLFDAPAYVTFREQIGTLVDAAPGAAGNFDPGSLSPLLFIAVSESLFSRWLPLRADPKADCVAPVVIDSTAAGQQL